MVAGDWSLENGGPGEKGPGSGWGRGNRGGGPGREPREGSGIGWEKVPMRVSGEGVLAKGSKGGVLRDRSGGQASCVRAREPDSTTSQLRASHSASLVSSRRMRGVYVRLGLGLAVALIDCL